MSEGTSRSTDSPSVGGTVAKFTLPAEDFAFAPMFERLSDPVVEIASTAACLDDHALVSITANERDRDGVDSALEADPALTDVRCIAERTAEWTYRVQWNGRARRLMEEFVAENATLLTARGRANRWVVRVLTPDRDALSRLSESIVALDYETDWEAITSYEGEGSNHSMLTDKQREALTAAYEAGYYHIPQETTADELADQLDITHQALSERLRRAYERLVKNGLVVDSPHRR